MAGITPPRDVMRRRSTACVMPPANAKVPAVLSRPETARLMAEPPVTAKTLSPNRPLLSLPLHIVAEVLSALGTVQHLPSTLLSHPIFYDAYRDFPSLVYGSLRSQIVDDEVYLLALVTYESDPARRLKFHKSSGDFLATYRDDTAATISSHQYIKLYEALRLGDFNAVIATMRDKFADRTLRRLYGIVDEATPLPEDAKNITLTEQRRIDRALYRFQMYCNLFSSQFRNGEEEVELKRIFYDKHSSWVNEQMGCVYDFLESELQLALDQVAATSAERAEWVNGENKHRQKQHYLSLGLAWLHQLITASVDEQVEMLEAAKDFHGSIDKIGPAIPPTPAAEQLKSFGDFLLKAGPTREWHDKINAILCANDPDKGPELLWKDTHKTGTNDVFFFVDHEFALRRVGYVIWDTARLAEEKCAGAIMVARADATPTFLSPGRLMNVARSWDKQFRAQRPAGPTSGRRVGRPTPSARPAPRPAPRASPRPAPRPAPGAAPRPAPTPLVNAVSAVAEPSRTVTLPASAAATSSAAAATSPSSSSSSAVAAAATMQPPPPPGPTTLPMRTSTPVCTGRPATPIRQLPQILVRPPTPRTIATQKVTVG